MTHTTLIGYILLSSLSSPVASSILAQPESSVLTGEDCRIVLPGGVLPGGQCPEGTYEHRDVGEDGDHCDGSPQSAIPPHCRPDSDAPAMPTLVCTPFSPRDVFCDVWPKGDQLSYEFWTSGSIQPSKQGASVSPGISYRCPQAWSSGVMHVFVISPGGLFSEHSFSLGCPGYGFVE